MIGVLVALTLACGAERWTAKVETDAQGGGAAPQVSTVEALTTMQVPFPKWSNDLPRTDVEKVCYQVTADLVGFKLEADLDWHLVLAGDSGQTMVAEMPDPSCAPNPETAAAFDRARKNLLRSIQTPRKGKLQRLKHPLRMTFVGMLFFDKIHGQDGVAANGVELHPVDVVP